MNNDNIVPFGRRKDDDADDADELIRACAACQCSTFKVSVSGMASCASCGQVMDGDGGPWFDPRKVVLGDEINPEAVKNTIVQMDTSKEALEAVAARIMEYHPRMVFAVYATSDGTVGWWNSDEAFVNQERIDWAYGRIDIMIGAEVNSGRITDGG